MESCYSGAAPGGYSSAPTTWNHAEGRAYQLTWKGCSALSTPSLPPGTPCALHCQGRQRPLWSWTDGSVTILGTAPLSGSRICASLSIPTVLQASEARKEEPGAN